MARIIVADDEPTHRDLVEEILARAGYDVVAVGSGRECLRQLRRAGAELVVTDIFMPDLDGFELMTALRAEGHVLPVIAMTGGLRGRFQPFGDAMTRLGACRVLSKPFTSDLLCRTVRSALGGEGCA